MKSTIQYKDENGMDKLKYTKIKPTQDIYNEYFLDNKENSDNMNRAIEAWQDHLSTHVFDKKFIELSPEGTPIHNTTQEHYDYCKDAVCVNCGQSRLEIRWGDGNPFCSNAQKLNNISDTIKSEENLYFELLNSASIKLPKIIKEKFNDKIDAKTLVTLQTTYGYEVDIVAGILDIDIEPMMLDYEYHMAIHKENSKNKNLPKGK